ncbi:MAG: metal-dependent transcriptional regulator [Actinomycetota bacterium]|nr:metal-dependent transcriptional regulator [Actinomycetota bacterium]
MTGATPHSGRREHGSAPSEAVEDYSKAIFMLQRHGRSVSNTALAERLGVTPASASAMVKRLAEMGLAEHEPYRGVSLTPAGEAVALEILRHHRLLETYLAEALGMPWDRVHDEAEVLEHYLSEELEELIAGKLGDPARDPHGDPIPDRNLVLPADDTCPLADLEPGDRAVFTRVSDSEPEMLRYLDERDIRPGVELRVEDKQPFGGPLFVRIGGRVHPLGGSLVRSMRVRVASRSVPS